MAFNLNDFRAKLVGGGARSSLFEVIITPPAFVGLDIEQFSFMCKAGSLPGSVIGRPELAYFGRRIKLGGDRVVEDWTVTAYNDEPFDIRNAFERWQSAIASHTTSPNALRSNGASSNPNSYVGQAVVNQKGKTGETIKSYKMINCWPTVISGIELDWGANDQIEEFTITLAYDLFDSDSVF